MNKILTDDGDDDDMMTMNSQGKWDEHRNKILKNDDDDDKLTEEKEFWHK